MLFVSKSFLFCFFVLIITECFSSQIQNHLKPIYNKEISNPFQNIDFIYLINLDRRPERLRNSLRQLSIFNIVPCRFPAIYGWDLSVEDLNDIGLKFQKGMQENQWCIHYPLQGNGEFEVEFLCEKSIGKIFFSRWISRGAMGCSLSHLSVLEDAYRSGYELIWVLEDDFAICGNVLELSDLVKKLDALVERKNWDILYTDFDSSHGYLYGEPNNFSFEMDLTFDLPFLWRPDGTSNDFTLYKKREVISSDFLKLGGRMLTTSMLITRTGIEKILKYEKMNGIFIPYDHELALVPGIRMFSLRYPLVSFTIGVKSDTQTENF